jgi:uncharacterized membrane protein (DUF2068 family)
MDQKKSRQQRTGIIRLIGIFRLLKGLALLAVGLGALRFLQRDVASTIQSWLEHWQVDPSNHYFQAVIGKVSHIDSHNLALMSAASCFYATLFLIEGVGLLMLKRWAEILTVIITASFIPLEIYHLIRQFSGMKVVVIIINAAIVVYLIWRLKKERHE